MLRNGSSIDLQRWRGLDTFSNQADIAPDTFFDSNNVLVNAKGQLEVLRSPKAFSSSTGGSGTLHGLTEYRRNSGSVLVVDRGTISYSLTSLGGAPASLRTGQSGNAWTSLTINDKFHRIDGTEFIQVLNNLSSIYRNGIDPPAAAPTIAYTTNGGTANVSILKSIKGSYAYYNTTTGQVSAPSPLSNTLTAATGNNAISFTVVASSQTGVDKVVFFLTVDGGAVPYLIILLTDASTVTANNTTATAYVYLASVTRDTLTPEPIYNNAPPVTGTFMFEHQGRILLIVDGGIRYSGFESCYMGNGQESWPENNQLNVPNRQDRAVGGLSTSVGALVFGKKDSYLIGQTLSDKTSSPNNAIAVTEKFTSMNWNIGITYPKTAVVTPFGPVWVDQTRRIQNWNLSGFPSEIGWPLRNELDSMTGVLTAQWFQHGKNGGYYVVTNGTKTLFVMLYTGADGQAAFGYGKSDLSIDAITTATFSNIERFFYAKTNLVYEILDPEQEGDGWDSDTEIFAKMMIGNDLNYSAIHSVQLDGDLLNVVFSISDSLESDAEDITLEDDLDSGGCFSGIVDSPQRRRHVFKATYDIDDSAYRSIGGLRFFIKKKKRVL